MFGQQIDESQLVHVLVQRNPLTAAQYDEVLGRARNLSLLARSRAAGRLRVLLVIHGTDTVSPTVRERVHELEDLAPKWDIAMVVDSPMIRSMESTLACFGNTASRRRSVFSTVAEACGWLIAGGADGLLLQALYRRAQREYEERCGVEQLHSQEGSASLAKVR